MPKAVIRDKYNSPDEQNFIKVGWSKEQSHVQIATIDPKGRLSKYREYIDEATGKGCGGYENLDVVEPGWFVTLGEEELKQLIKSLQQAGRQVYGKSPW